MINLLYSPQKSTFSCKQTKPPIFFAKKKERGVSEKSFATTIELAHVCHDEGSVGLISEKKLGPQRLGFLLMVLISLWRSVVVVLISLAKRDYRPLWTRKFMAFLEYLVGGPGHPSEKYEFVSWDDD